jgi:hypothetical protein
MAWLSLVGSGISAVGQMQQGIDEKRAADVYAGEIEAAGGIQDYQMGEREESLLSTQRALYAKAGVRNTGSPLEVALQTATDAEFDKMIADWNIQVKARDVRQSGKYAESAGQLSGLSTLLGGAAKAYSTYGGATTVPTADSRGTAGGYAAYQGSQ